MSAHNQVRAWIKSGRTITQQQAIAKFGNYRLAVIIDRLRNDEKIDIVTLMMPNKREGTHAKYKLRRA